MYSIFLFIIIVIVVILVLGLSIVEAVLKTIFGMGRRSSSRPQQKGYDHSNPHQYQQNNASSSSCDEGDCTANTSSKSKHKKLFTKDEGEYVDFEEIKE